MSQYAPRAAPPTRPARRNVALWGGLLLAVLLPAFGGLGLWQWGKWQDKEARQSALDRHRLDAPLAMPGRLATAGELRDRRFSLHGEYDARHQVLIDNRVLHGQAGYHVVTPLRLAGSSTHVLVNRGWVPAPAEHSQVPDVPPPRGPLTVSGVAVLPGERFFTLGASPGGDWRDWRTDGPAVWQNLDWPRFQRAFGQPLQPVVIQLDAGAPGGYRRDWPRPDERAERHLSYALQWFGFAVASVGIWLYFLLRRP